MTFHWPQFFWLLLLPLALALVELRRRHVLRNHLHPKILRAEAGPRSLALTPQAPASRSPFRWRLWLGLSFAIVALARPQWGRLDEPVFDQSREIMIALDLSRSMLAEDIRPSRLERAKLLVSSLLEQLRGERVGLIVFSGTAFLQSPLSADYEILRDFLPNLNPSYLPEGGTNYSALLETARQAFGTSGSADRFLIILSDGEATDDDWKSQETALKEKGIRVLSLGVGTTAGAMIPDGAGAFVKDERGAVVLSKLESNTLRELASDTRGVYADASTWVDVSQLIESTVAAAQKGTFVERSRIRLTERFQWVLGPALFFLFWSFLSEFPVRPRVRDVASVPPLPKSKRNPSAARAAAAAMILPILAGLCLAGTAHLKAAPTEAASNDRLAKLVAALSQNPSVSAHDYADLAHATLSYGKDLQSAQKHVPAGPVNDALAAVDEGERLSKKAADWPTLRSELQALLRKKDPPPPQPQPQQSPQQKKEDQQQDKKQPQQQQPQSQKSEPQKQNQPQEKQEQQQNEPAQKSQPPEKSAFGDMKDHSTEKSGKPPQPSDPTEEQKVGGAQEKKETGSTKDPALAMPLQKLEQLKGQDSPARLYQLMQGQNPTPKKTGKDW